MIKKKNKLEIVELTKKLAEDWSEVFLDGMKKCQWTMKYLLSQKITKYDVRISIIEDLNNRSSSEQFLIAYFNSMPAGIIRLDSYYTPNSCKILSHFPLVKTRFQRKGIGKALVRRALQNAINHGRKSLWHECWALNEKEILEYESFYEKIGFMEKSSRMEMSCIISNLSKRELKSSKNINQKISDNISEDFISAISKSYLESKDILHKIENLGKREIAKDFLLKTHKSFTSEGFNVEYRTAYHSGKLCGGLMTAIEYERGMILEIGVLPKYRGKKIATTLISDFLNEMKEKKIKEISLGVDKENIPAINLYKKFNFKPTWHGKILKLENFKILGLDKNESN